MAVCFLAFVLALFPGWARSEGDPLLVFAAASLADALSEIGRDFESTHGVRVRFNFAGSSILARQIAAGAPADVFLSADEAKMDRLEKEGRLVEDSRRSLLGNQLALIVPAARGDSRIGFADLASPAVRRLALADPRSVPAGLYARDFLVAKGLWPQVEPKVIPMANVRSALAAVESGNVDAGIVYRTDALRSDRVRICEIVAVADGPVISYPVACLRRDLLHPAAGAFVAFLGGDRAVGVFTRHGFSMAGPTMAVAGRDGEVLP